MKIAQEVKQLSDVQLLERINNDGEADIYYEEFINRFLPIVQAKCDEICRRRRLDIHIGQEIAHNTFDRVRRTKSFNKERLRPGNEKVAIAGFLYRISVNLFNDHHNKEKIDDALVPSYLDAFFDEASEIGAVSNNEQIVAYTQRILSILSERERKVLLVDLEYKRHKKYLPDEVVASLCNELKIKPASLRKIRERLIIKVKNEIDVINREQEA